MRNLVKFSGLASVLLVLGVSNLVWAAEMTPKQFYLQYHQKCLAVSSPKVLLPFRSKDSIARDQAMSDDEIESVYPMIKDMMSKNVTVISEEIKGDRATLKVTGEVPEAATVEVEKAKVEKAKTQTGKTAAKKSETLTKASSTKAEQALGVVLLVKEDGQWKLDHESWTSR